MKTFLSFVLGKQNNSFCVDNGNHVFYISTNWMEHLCLWGKIKKKLIKVSSKIHFILLVMSPFLIFSHLLSVVHSICTHPIGTREATATSFFCSVTASLFASFSFLTLVSSIITLDYQQGKSRLLVLALDINPHWTIRMGKQTMWKMSPPYIMIFKCNGSKEETQRTI